MLKRKLFFMGAILTVAMLVGAAACTPAELQALQGTLNNVDSVSGNVTVTMKDGTTRTFNFTDVKVDTIKQALGSATLEIGDQVTVKVHKNGDVEEVDVKYAEVHGSIKSLGTGNVTITTKKQGDITLNITTETKLRIEDKGAAVFSDLKAGQEVEARYDVTTKNALRININTEEQEEGEIEGTITALDTAGKTVTITPEKKSAVTLTVTAETVIRIEDKGTAAFSDLKVGQKVEARYDASSLKALKLEVEENQGEDD